MRINIFGLRWASINFVTTGRFAAPAIGFAHIREYSLPIGQGPPHDARGASVCEGFTSKKKLFGKMAKRAAFSKDTLVCKRAWWECIRKWIRSARRFRTPLYEAVGI